MPHQDIITYIPNNAQQCNYPLPIPMNLIKSSFHDHVCCDNYTFWVESFCYQDNLILVTWMVIMMYSAEMACAAFLGWKTISKMRKIVNYNVYDRDDKTYCVMMVYVLYFIRI